MFYDETHNKLFSLFFVVIIIGIFEPVVQPALGILMIGSAAGGKFYVYYYVLMMLILLSISIFIIILILFFSCIQGTRKGVIVDSNTKFVLIY